MLRAALARMVWKNTRHRKASKLGIQPNEASDLRPSLRIEFLKRDLTDHAVSSVPPSVHLWSDPSPKQQHEQRHHQSTHRHAQFLQDHLLNGALSHSIAHLGNYADFGTLWR